MKIILLGMPGSGKGTIATWLTEERGYTHISTGDILRREREASTELGGKVKKIMDEGKLVSDDIMITIIQKFLQENSKAQGIVFDGFPRTLDQALALDKIVTIEKVIFIKVDEEEVVRRILGRAEKSDKRREDDTEEVIRKRIKIFYQNIRPLIDFCQKKNLLVTIDGGQGISQVRALVDSVLK